MLKYFLSCNLQILKEKNLNYEEGVFQAIQIYFSLFHQIPQTLSNFAEEKQLLENINHYNKFKQCFESSQFSIVSLQGWLSFYDNQKNQQSIFQPSTLEDELEKVVLVILIQFQQNNSDNKITYKTINHCYLNCILDFDKIFEQKNKNQKDNRKQNIQKDQQENVEQSDKSQSIQQEINEQDKNQNQHSHKVTNKCEELISTNEIVIGEKINEDLNEQANKLSQESQQKQNYDLEIKLKGKELEDELENEELNHSQKFQQDDFGQSVDEQFNDQFFDEIFDEQYQESQQQNYNDQLDEEEQDQKLENSFQSQNNIKQQDKTIEQEVIRKENKNLMNEQMLQKQGFETNKRIIAENDNEDLKYPQFNKEKNLQQEIVNDININNQNSVQQIKSKSENQQENDTEPIIQSSLLSQEKQQDQINPLIILTQQEKYLNQVTKVYNELIFISNENLNQFYELCLSLIKFLLKLIQEQGKWEILNKENLMIQLFLLTYNITNQQRQSELSDQITKLFLEQKFEDTFLGNDLDSICQVLQSNDFHLVKYQNFSENKQVVIDSVQLGFPKLEIMSNDLEILQSNKQDFNYFGIRSTFINIGQKNKFQKSLIYEKIYALKNKLRKWLEGKNQTYIQFKEYSQILQLISDIELEVDEQNKQNFQNQIVEQQVEYKLEFWITKLLKNEEIMRFTQAKVL